MRQYLMSPLWLRLWTVGLICTWIFPNHHRPWTAFHVDVWISIVLLVAGFAIVSRIQRIEWHGITLFAGSICFLPWAQFFWSSGLLHIENTWLVFLYFLGFSMCILVAAQWERLKENQCLDTLFFAIGIACLISVSLQLHQWLALDYCNLLCMGGTERPFGNLGQSNQLATLLLWGLVAVGWGVVRGKIKGMIGVVLSCYFLFGLALTFSRTAWLAIPILLLCSLIWRQLFKSKAFVWCVLGLALFFLFCVWFVSYINSFNSLDDLVRVSTEIRPIAWAMFVDAALREPWFGYGWNQTVNAHVAAAVLHPQLPSAFTYSHNLLLDLVLWCGIPIGVGLFSISVWWVIHKAINIKTSREVLIFMAFLIIGNHSMFEFPLYYAYFLFPLGLMVGVLSVRYQDKIIFRSSRFILIALLVGATLLLGCLIRDYSRVETSYNLLRMELDRFEITSPKVPPDVLMLSLWNDYIRYARVQPHNNMSSQEIKWMREVVTSFPNALFIYKFAMSLALNEQPKESELWLKRMQKLVPEADYLVAQKMWERERAHNKEIEAVAWP